MRGVWGQIAGKVKGVRPHPRVGRFGGDEKNQYSLAHQLLEPLLRSLLAAPRMRRRYTLFFISAMVFKKCPKVACLAPLRFEMLCRLVLKIALLMHWIAGFQR